MKKKGNGKKLSKQALKVLRQAVKEWNEEEQREALKGDTEFNNLLSEIKNQILEITERDKTEVYRKGELLMKAKPLVGHGRFKKWVEDNFEFSYQTANNMMNVYRCCTGNPDIVKTIKLSLLYTISSPDFPKDLRKHIFEHKEDLKKIENKQLRDVYKRFKKGELDLDDPEIVSLFKQEYAKEIDSKIDEIEKLKATVLSKVNNFNWPVFSETCKIAVQDNQLKKVENLVEEIVSAVKKLTPKESKSSKQKLQLAK